MAEHRDQNGEPAVSQASKRAAMRVTVGTHLGVELLATGIADHADARPMVEGVSQSFVATPAHEHHKLFPALPGDRCRAGVAAESVIISVGDSLRGFAEHRGGDLSSDSWQGQKHFGVTMLARRIRVAAGNSEFGQESLDATSDLLTLLVEKAQAGQEQQGVFAGRLGRARGQAKGRLGQDGVNLLCAPPANAMAAQDASDARFRDLGGSGG